MKKSIGSLVSVLLLAVFLSPGPFCWGQATGVADPQGKDPAEEFAESLPYVDQVRRQGGYLELGVKDAVRLALSNNLEIAIEDYNEGITRELIHSAKGFYDPEFSFGAGWVSSESPAISILDAGRGITTSSSSEAEPELGSISHRMYVDGSRLQRWRPDTGLPPCGTDRAAGNGRHPPERASQDDTHQGRLGAVGDQPYGVAACGWELNAGTFAPRASPAIRCAWASV